MSSAAATDEERGSFIRARLASLLAIAPLGVWTVGHVWSNLASLQGAQAWEQSVTGHAHPVATLVTSVVVLLPLLLHTVWGLGRLLSFRPNNGRYNFFNNLKYILQRASAVGVLLFLLAHLTLAFIKPRFLEGHPETFRGIASEMFHNAPTLPVYLLGTLGVAYHLANGVYTFCMGWGVAVGRNGLKNVQIVSWLIFVVMLAMSWGALYGLWSAGSALPAPGH